MFVSLIFERLKEKDPSPQTELFYTNTYTLLIAVLLSAQATDKGVNKATKKLFEKISSPQEMLSLGEERLKEHIKTIGLYPTKAKNILLLSKILVNQYESQVPDNREALESLPGVGRKTANVVLNVAFYRPTIPVDTHVFRLAHRLGLSKSSTPLGVEKDLEKIIPLDYKEHAHHWLILHGRYTCKAQKPLCQTCCLQDLCPSALFR